MSANIPLSSMLVYDADYPASPNSQGAQPLQLRIVIRYHPTIVDFADERFAETGWQNLNGQLFGRTFDRVDLRPYKDTELSFDNTAQEVIASQLCVRAHTDKGVKEIGIGVGIALTRSGLIYPRPTFSD